MTVMRASLTVMRPSFERQSRVKSLMRPIESPVDGHPVEACTENQPKGSGATFDHFGETGPGEGIKKPPNSPT
jgi:hypothetical protein